MSGDVSLVEVVPVSEVCPLLTGAAWSSCLTEVR